MILFSRGNAEDYYEYWYNELGSPSIIISDGPYGLGIYKNEVSDYDILPDIYSPHIDAWNEYSDSRTVLYFFGNEPSWATIHPELIKNGWKYINLIVWNKGIRHVSGRTNSKTLRSYPIVTEIIGFYAREKIIKLKDQAIKISNWLRSEWKRAGFSFRKADEVCGTSNAAQRKWFSADEHWYFPPEEQFKKIVEYANKHGKKDGMPYFENEHIDISDRDWYKKIRYHFKLPLGITNVWNIPPIKYSERLGHKTQKPIEIMERIIKPHDMGNKLTIWEPFGGTGTASFVANKLGHNTAIAEIVPEYQEIIKKRLFET